ncbi:MAG TPA: alpha/beta fold hydrolase [Thermoclostridium sp.]|nr:alpha/beta fold hydrolase [Thermoclostridium sp.]
MKKYLVYILAVMLLLTGCGGNAPGETGTPASPSTASSPGPGGTNIEEIAVNLISDMAAGEFDKAVSDYPYTQEMKNVITDGKFLKDQIWTPLISVYGEFTEITGTVASEYQGYDIISVKTSFENARIYINVVFNNGLIAGLNLAPDPEGGTPAKAPESVTEKEITFGKLGWELPGTLTKPAGNGPFPVVILVHGSGANDRDETAGANKPFRDIAYGLAQRGIATLRYDKRTMVHAQKISGSADFTVYEETVEDAVLAYELLRGDSSIDKDNIYILGHSLGGMMIPRIAKLTPGAAGYIIMAGAVTPLEDLMIKQISYLNELDGTVTDQEEQILESYKAMRDNVKALTPGTDIPPEQLFGTPASYWLDLKDYNPANEARAIDRPLLFLQGERDYQVTMEEFELWKEALGNRSNATFKSYDGLNHLMIYGSGTPGPQEYNTPGKVDERVIEDIASWILER